MSARRLLRGAALLLAAVAAWQAAVAAWIPAKAWLAQRLLERTWMAARRDGRAAPPWPWADTVPVARLRVPRLGVDAIVLDGDSGRVLAFGPGWAPSSAAPGAAGLGVISGHRDTAFAFLRELRDGDAIELQTLRATRRYRVVAHDVVDSRVTRLATRDGGDGLALVTCWPFDAVVPGGPLRYVVTARPATPQAPATAPFIAATTAR